MPPLTNHQAITYALTYLSSILCSRNKCIANLQIRAPTPGYAHRKAEPGYSPMLDTLFMLASPPPPIAIPDFVMGQAVASFETLIRVLGYIAVSFEIHPITMEQKILIQHQMQEVSGAAERSPRRRQKTMGRKCDNCGQTSTRQWVRGRKHIDEWLCHPCGQFWRKNNKSRPPELWNRPTYRRASRKKNPSGSALGGDSIQPDNSDGDSEELPSIAQILAPM